ncbi:argininosuccinate lyase-like isoform X2 [Leptotrombidium deliense]|uniref:Argininosuccinate lyase-like isoform X2 n=1 Tax=Leptotrombidium deliense TaxID=299467 RepID=A0A443SWJ6_9ACAR|nr:argininosuccinate lyase-like isoform X2 [Leptotrombidium deliense]
MSAQLWGSRFTTGLDPQMQMFNASIKFDQRLHKNDLEGSIAYAKALHKANLLSEQECKSIVDALIVIGEEWKNNCFVIEENDEDIHTAHERRLKQLVGDEVGGKLHTGRSRNDQVATDLKLWLREGITCLKHCLLQIVETIVLRAEKEIEVIFPGYTHLQRAQPVRWSHWLLSYVCMFVQDFERLHQLNWRLNVCPLGSGAIAGNPFSVDTDFIAQMLSFRTSSSNSMYSVGDRDFVADFQFWASLTAVHLSKLAEDLIIYSTKEFSFHRKQLNATKKECRQFGANPWKATPSTFNKDLQEDKEGIFDTFDTIKNMLDIANGTVATLSVSGVQWNSCRNALSSDMFATDIAYFLVRKGLPFRKAHEIAGKVISTAEQLQCDVVDVPLEKLRTIKYSKNLINQNNCLT